MALINLKHGDYEYPISYQLIKDGRKNKVLNKKIYQDLKITMVHGTKTNQYQSFIQEKYLRFLKQLKKN